MAEGAPGLPILVNSIMVGFIHLGEEALGVESQEPSDARGRLGRGEAATMDATGLARLGIVKPGLGNAMTAPIEVFSVGPTTGGGGQQSGKEAI